FEMAPLLSSGDGNDVVTFVQQPRQRNLSHSRAFAPGKVMYERGGAHVGVEVLALIARVFVTKVARRVFLSAFHVAREKATTERREGNDADAEFSAEWDD